MIDNNSVVITVAASDRDLCNAALTAWWGDVGAQEFAVELSSAGLAPATHYAMHAWVSDADAAALSAWPAGSVPVPRVPWSSAGLDAAQAAQAGALMHVSIMQADQDDVPAKNFGAACASLGLQQIETVYAPSPTP